MKIIIKDLPPEIYNNKDKIIVIAGKWASSGEYNKFTKVYGRKQGLLLNNNNCRSVDKYAD